MNISRKPRPHHAVLALFVIVGSGWWTAHFWHMNGRIPAARRRVGSVHRATAFMISSPGCCVPGMVWPSLRPGISRCGSTPKRRHLSETIALRGAHHDRHGSASADRALP